MAMRFCGESPAAGLAKRRFSVQRQLKGKYNRGLNQRRSGFMKTLIGGAVAAVLGLIGLTLWFPAFLQLLAGAIPIMLLLGGGLAIYLGFDELKDNWKKDDTEVAGASDSGSYKQEIDDLKKEIESLKSEKA
jgi:hypothetical protein